MRSEGNPTTASGPPPLKGEARLTLGSLFDGIGGFPLAGTMAGMRPVWASEIEAFPLRVTAARFPEMEQLGSVTDIDGGKIEPVDVITFGSPCQDLSVAGKQLGIHEGQRSNLFFEAIRIIKEMRDADAANGRSDKHIRPRFAVWENVPGAFSRNKGEDFRAVLEALAGIAENGVAIPRPKKWDTGGGIVGHGWSLAWRVYDAQYWGVPQRRKRIYLVADFGSERAGEILFEREDLRGNIAQGRAAGEGAAGDAAGGAGGGCGVRCLNPWDCESKRLFDVNGAMHTLYSHENGGGHFNGVCYPAIAFTERGRKDGRNCEVMEDVMYALTCPGDGGRTNSRQICYAIQGNFIDRETKQTGAGWRDGDSMYTLDATDRHGVCYPETARSLCSRHDSSPCVDRGQNEIAFAWTNSGKAGLSEGDISPTLKVGGEPAIALMAGGEKAREYDGHYGEIAPTIRANAANTKPSVVYNALCVGNGQLNQISMAEQANTLDCMHDQQAVVYPGVGITSRENRSNPQPGDPAPTISTDSRNYLVKQDKPPRKYIVRRLTPLECVRLQGYPDWWFDGVDGSDSAKYKALGNSLAIPCAYDVMDRIARFVEGEGLGECGD